MYIVRFVISAIVFSLLSGCSFYHFDAIKPKAQHASCKGNQSTLFKHWDAHFKRNHQQNPIQLLPHQKYPLFYLDKHPEQRGLILDYKTGTGKTFTAIGFAEKYPDRPVIILAPKFLHSHWLEHLKQYRIKNKARYRFVSHDNCISLLEQDVSNAIVIVDESHRFIERVRFGGKLSNQYSQLYLHLRKCHKVLSLSATPIYNDIFDLAYQINLVSGRDLLPFNQKAFQKICFGIDEVSAYWRGHLLTSHYFINELLAPVLGGGIGAWIGYSMMPSANKNNGSSNLLSTFGYSAAGKIAGSNIGLMVGGSIPTWIEKLIPLHSDSLKKFQIDNLGKLLSCYFAHYSLQQSTHDYPTKSFSLETLNYNVEQLDFLYKFYDSQLNEEHLHQLLKDSLHSNTKAEIALNSTQIQDTYKKRKGAGREIGNLPFSASPFTQKKDFSPVRNKSSASYHAQMRYPDKFEAILKAVEKSKGPVVIYSHYYYNGLLLFKQFLDTKGYQGKYALFHPEMHIAQHKDIIDQFNANKLKILLLHPEITEGISLKGTQQLHFLEMPINKLLEQQIIGRAIRYRSHVHLPLSEQHVKVYFWAYNIPKIQGHLMARKNWHRQFAQLNYYSTLGDLKAVDENIDLKRKSPDVRAYEGLNELHQRMTLFTKFLEKCSIEQTTHSQQSL